MIYTPKRHSVYRSSYAKLHVSNIIVQIDIVWYIFETRLETKIFASWTKSTLLRIYFRNSSVQKSFLQYKSQCLEKVNVKYVIKRLWYGKCIVIISYYHMFCCNMFVFACPIIDRSQCWLFALRANIRICPHISVFVPYFTSGICAMVSKIICPKYKEK